MTEISYQFWFDAAHRFMHQPAGHKYGSLHGHSFRAQIAVRGEPDPQSGFVVDFAELEAAGQHLRGLLDHRFLNEIEELGNPSLEHISRFIWRQLKPQFDGLVRVSVKRDSQGQSCTYFGDSDVPANRLSEPFE